MYVLKKYELNSNLRDEIEGNNSVRNFWIVKNFIWYVFLSANATEDKKPCIILLSNVQSSRPSLL